LAKQGKTNIQKKYILTAILVKIGANNIFLKGVKEFLRV
jgi:hypothetical protein